MATAQSLTEQQQKAINNYISYANHLTGELDGLGSSLVQAYRQMIDSRTKPNRPVSPYQCKLGAKEYYYEEALKTASALGQAGAGLAVKADALQKAYQKVDATCKGIEIYFRLKDYEADMFKKFEEHVRVLETELLAYSKQANELHAEAEKVFYSLQPHHADKPYHKADKLMREQLSFEKELLDAFRFNVNESVHTGWPLEKTQKHILDAGKKIDVLKREGTGVNYPASSMFKSFVSSIESLQQSKRLAVDGYTFEKQQSDGHSNSAYNNLINYYTNTGVSFYNNFINQSRQDGYHGIYYLEYVPLFTVLSTIKEIKLDVIPFEDKSIAEIKVVSVSAPVTPAVFTSLSNYIDFINEGVRQINHMTNPIWNLNSSASSGVARLKAGSKVTLSYYHKNFELPVTLYQETIDKSKSVPAAYRNSLNEQAEVLYSILTELNQWNNLLVAEAASKQLEKDSMNYVYSIFVRFKSLVQVFDQKKERLYTDVRKITDAYPPANPKSPWQISGNGMLALLDEDHKELYKAKKFLTGDVSSTPSTAEIDRMSRELIVNEFTNLTGLQKLGRNNGNCPYTPYEDIAQYSKHFSESLTKMSPGKASSYYRHPYNELLYKYNETLARHYNKFTELSKVPLLKAAMQLEYFEIIEPKSPEVKIPVAEAQVEKVVAVVQTETKPQSIQQKEEESSKSKSKKEKQPEKPPSTVVGGGVVHDTVRITDIIRIETIRQDTVYVSRVDTVFIGIPGEDIMSMEGYAINNVVLLLDVSGSMNSPDKLPLLKKSVFLLMKMMRPEDQVSIVTYSGKAKIELQATSFTDEGKIRHVVERLKSEGKTDGNAGIKLAYQVADKNYIRGGNNRIILATDGEFGIGNPTYDLVKKSAAEDIFISVFNFGQNSGSVKNLKQLVTLGKGNYEEITRENADMKLIMEVKAKKMK